LLVPSESIPFFRRQLSAQNLLLLPESSTAVVAPNILRSRELLNDFVDTREIGGGRRKNGPSKPRTWRRLMNSRRLQGVHRLTGGFLIQVDVPNDR
jgi:hypothetical protein